MSENTVSENAIVIERIFDAPVELIWQMWTQPEHFKIWYAPEGFTVPVTETDLRVGGKRTVCMEMQTPDGPMKIWSSGEYTEIIPNQRLAYTEVITDENGNILGPADTEVSVSLEAVDGRTKMVMTHVGLPANQVEASAGWTQSFDKLAAYIETIRNA